MSFILDFLGMNVPSDNEAEYYPDRGQNAGAKRKPGRPRKVGRPKKKKLGRPRKVGRPKKVKTKRKSKSGGGVGHGRHAYGMSHSEAMKRFPQKAGSCCASGTCHQFGRGVGHGRHAYGMSHSEAMKRFPQKAGLGIREIKKLEKKSEKLQMELGEARMSKREDIKKKLKGVENMLKRLRMGGGAKKRGPGRPRNVGRPKGKKMKKKRSTKKKVSGYFSY